MMSGQRIPLYMNNNNPLLCIKHPRILSGKDMQCFMFNLMQGILGFHLVLKAGLKKIKSILHHIKKKSYKNISVWIPKISYTFIKYIRAHTYLPGASLAGESLSLIQTVLPKPTAFSSLKQMMAMRTITYYAQ